MAKPISKRRETTLAILKAYESMEIDRIMSFRADNCIQIIGPCKSHAQPIRPFTLQLSLTNLVAASLERPIMNNERYRSFFTPATARIWNFNITIKDIIEDTAANKTVVYAKSTGDTAAGPKTYGNEYFILFEFDESQEKITKMVEYVDSAKSREQVKVLRGE